MKSMLLRLVQKRQSSPLVLSTCPALARRRRRRRRTGEVEVGDEVRPAWMADVDSGYSVRHGLHGTARQKIEHERSLNTLGK